MIHSRTPTSGRSLETLFQLGSLGNQDDAQLLEWFRTCNNSRGAEAFRVLVERYGPIVMGVCRGVLGDENEADDAFQATFLILVRKAGSIRYGESIGPWLHGVALRVARRARAQAARRSALEKPLDRAACVPADPKCEPGERELIGIVHDEIARFPEKLRGPLVLCCLEELSYQQAARELGVNEPTLRGRLHRARQRLEARLRARGIARDAILPLGPRATPLLATASPALVEGTVQLVSRWSALGRLVVAAGSPTVQVLAQGVLTSMFCNSFKTAVVPALLAASVLGTAVLAQQDRTGGQAVGRPGRESTSSGGSSEVPPPTEKKQPGGVDLKTIQERVIKDAANRLRFAAAALNRQELDRKTAHIHELLARKSDLAFPKGVTLLQFLKAVKLSTTSKDDPGIPIYVNPIGMQEADKTLESLVVIDVNPGQHTLADVLQLALRIINLGYDVHDGFLCIDSRLGSVESRMTRVEEKLDRIMNALEKLATRP